MKTTNETVYRCDFCNRAIVSKGSMVVHEKMCKQNPENFNKCFQYCQSLQKDTNPVLDKAGDVVTFHVQFTCLAKDIILKSYKVKRNKYLMENFKDIDFMPKECDLLLIHSASNPVQLFSTAFFIHSLADNPDLFI